MVRVVFASDSKNDAPQVVKKLVILLLGSCNKNGEVVDKKIYMVELFFLARLLSQFA